MKHVQLTVSPAPRPADPVPDIWRDDSIALIRDLERGSALSSFQAELLLASWPWLDDQWPASPYFGTVREHTRMFLDQLRSSTTIKGDDS